MFLFQFIWDLTKRSTTAGDSWRVFPMSVSSSHRCGLSSVAEGGTLHVLWERENFVRKSSFGCVYMWRFPSLDSHLPLPRIFFFLSPMRDRRHFYQLGNSLRCSCWECQWLVVSSAECVQRRTCDGERVVASHGKCI